MHGGLSCFWWYQIQLVLYHPLRCTDAVILWQIVLHQITAMTLEPWRSQVYDITSDRVLYDFVTDPYVANEIARQEQMNQYEIRSGPSVPCDAPIRTSRNPFDLLKHLKES